MRFLLTISFCTFICLSFGQTNSTFSIEKEGYLIGDQIPITFELIIPSASDVIEMDLSPLANIRSTEGELDTNGQMVYPVPDYEILDFGFWQTNKAERIPVDTEFWKVEDQGTHKRYTNTIRLTFWETGTFEIQDISYFIDQREERIEQSSSGRKTIIISAPGNLEAMAPDTVEIAPIKDIIKEPTLWTDYLNYLYSLLSLFLIGLLIYYFKNLNKKEEKEEEVIVRPAHEIAMEQLEALEAQKLWQSGNVKSYQSKLTHIIREYLENRYGINALEMTTDEIVVQLKKVDFEMRWKDSLKRILQIADLVKFAKAKPPHDINQEFMDEAKSFIENTKVTILVEEEMNTATDE